MQAAFRIGGKKKRDKIFGGAKLEMVKDVRTTFADIAGIDQVGKIRRGGVVTHSVARLQHVCAALVLNELTLVNHPFP